MATGFVGIEVELPRLPFLPPADQPIADSPEPSPTGRSLQDQQPLHPINRSFHHFVQRLLDWLIILLASGFLFPLILLISVAIKLDSPGPILTSQERIGLRHRRCQGKVTWEQTSFPLYLFRTTTADQSVTVVGRILRQTSLDQLPQLWNILKGDLTLVGPRPLFPPMPFCDTPQVEPPLEKIPGMFDISYSCYKRS